MYLYLYPSTESMYLPQPLYMVGWVERQTNEKKRTNERTDERTNKQMNEVMIEETKYLANLSPEYLFIYFI